MEIVILWLIFAFVVAYLGDDRKIGGGWSFLWAIILSPVVGFIIVAFSPSLLSLERDKVQAKQLEEMSAIRASLTRLDCTQTEQPATPDCMQTEQPADPDCPQTEQPAEPKLDPNEPAIDVPKLTAWQRIKYRI